METDSYSANQRRAINLVWTACGDYQFEPQFLALKADGTPDFYMNCVIGLVRKWLGDEMPRRLFALWADDTRRSAFDDLAWLALENAVYEKELPVRPCSRSCAAPTPQNFLPRNISSRGRSGWTRTSSSTRSSPPAGDLSLGRSRRCSPRGEKGALRSPRLPGHARRGRSGGRRPRGV